VEPITEFFVSTAAAGYYLAARSTLPSNGADKPSDGWGCHTFKLRALRQTRGVEVLSFVHEDKDQRRKSAQAGETEASASPKSKKKRPPLPEVGQALRSAYQQAIDEAIPPEMLDLLGKLG
jgi:hypothetical protein